MGRNSILSRYTVRYIDKNEANGMNQIFLLRVLCRENEGYVNFHKFPNGWKDYFDNTAYNFGCFMDDELIAAIRLNYYENINECPYFIGFNLINEIKIEGYMAYISRLSIHPSYQKLGISKLLFDCAENHSKAMKCYNILGDCYSPLTDKYSSAPFAYKIVGKLSVNKVKDWPLKPFDSDLIYKNLLK